MESELQNMGWVLLFSIIAPVVFGAWMHWDDAKRKRTEYKHNGRNPK